MSANSPSKRPRPSTPEVAPPPFERPPSPSSIFSQPTFQHEQQALQFELVEPFLVEPEFKAEGLHPESVVEPPLPPHPELITEENLAAFVLPQFLNMFTQETEDREMEVESEADATSASSGSVNSDDGPSAESFRGGYPLYSGAPITLHESFTSILTLVLTFKLTGVCIKAILDLIGLHLPKENIFRTSLQAFKDYFLYLQGPKSFEYYCSKCFKNLKPKTKCEQCPESKICYLVKLSIVQQLETLFQRKGFYSKLQFPSDPNCEEIRDVYNGQQYANMVSCGRLGQDGKLSGKWYTDGAQLYKSSNVSVWPLYLSINELPYSERFKPKNVLVPVIWCGPVKPPMNLLFSAAHLELHKLNSGVNFDVRDHGEKKITFLVLDGTGDTPARSAAMNLCQFNGEHACQRCLQKGEPRDGCPGVRIFPYLPQEMTPRTLAGWKEHAKEATPEMPVMGVKGPSVLTKLTPNMVLGTTVDAMHQTYGGIGKKTLKLLTSTKEKDKGKWNISQHVNTINFLLLSIKTPAHVERIPRSLSDQGFWKIKETKAWFEDYSLPILHGLLPSRLLAHHATVVAAIQLLNADVITQESLGTAKLLLEAYVGQFADFYDVKYMTMNFHLLLHLPEIVKDNGPLWCYACFLLEGINGIILSLVHGTRWPERQIATSLQTCLGLPDLVDKLPDSPFKTFCRNLMNRRKYIRSQGVEEMKIIDTQVPLQTGELRELLVNLNYTSARKFSYLRKGKYLYATAPSQLSKNRDSSAAVYECDGVENVGIIQSFLKLNQCSCVSKCTCPCSLYVVLEKMNVTYQFPTLIPNFVVPNNKQYRSSDCTIIVSAKVLKCVCVKIYNGDKLYISRPANTHEYE